MKVSLNQIEQTARKAVRGAGYAWGLADDTGRALRWLHAYRLDGASALATHLDAGAGAPPSALTDRDAWQASAGILDPLAAGAAMADSIDAMRGDIETAAIAHPLLAAAFVICAAESDGLAFEVTWQGCSLRCARGRVQIRGAVDATVTDHLHCRALSPNTVRCRIRAPRLGETSVAADAWEALQRHARRTHVPASAASRLAGAGAGLRDND